MGSGLIKGETKCGFLTHPSFLLGTWIDSWRDSDSGKRRDQAWDFDISFLSPREAMYHPTLNPARIDGARAFRSVFTRTVVDKAANWDSRAIFQPPIRLGVVDSNWNSQQTINDCDVCVCVCVRIACAKV